MSGRYVDIDMSEFKEFFGSLERAARGDFRKEFELFLEGLGNEFLRILQDEIVRRKVMDSRQLLASFEKGGDGNVWSIEEGGLVLEVGTSVEYAGYVNDGHWTNTKGVERRFVPDAACSAMCERRYQIYKRMQAGLKYITEGTVLG